MLYSDVVRHLDAYNASASASIVLKLYSDAEIDANEDLIIDLFIYKEYLYFNLACVYSDLIIIKNCIELFQKHNPETIYHMITSFNYNCFRLFVIDANVCIFIYLFEFLLKTKPIAIERLIYQIGNSMLQRISEYSYTSDIAIILSNYI